MKRGWTLLFVLLLLLLVSGVSAMSSANFNLDWYVPLTSGGGGPVGSANYQANFTVGQSVIGASSSASYRVGLGYWYGYGAVVQPGSFRIFLPVVLKGS